MTVSWFVAKTNPRCEERAAAGLIAKGFEVHLPRGVKLVRRRKVRQPIPTTFSLLTGYMFVGVGPTTPGFYHLRSTDGIHSVLGRQVVEVGQEARNRYVPVSSSIVDEFRRLEASGAFDASRANEPPPRIFSRGDAVEVKAGPLAGTRFVFDDYFGRNSAKVLCEIFGTLRAIDIADVDCLRRVA